jgi:hypothetical protein
MSVLYPVFSPFSLTPKPWAAGQQQRWQARAAACGVQRAVRGAGRRQRWLVLQGRPAYRQQRPGTRHQPCPAVQISPRRQRRARQGVFHSRLPRLPCCCGRNAATHPGLAEVDAAHQLPDDEDVHALHQLALRGVRAAAAVKSSAPTGGWAREKRGGGERGAAGVARFVRARAAGAQPGGVQQGGQGLRAQLGMWPSSPVQLLRPHGNVYGCVAGCCRGSCSIPQGPEAMRLLGHAGRHQLQGAGSCTHK